VGWLLKPELRTVRFRPERGGENPEKKPGTSQNQTKKIPRQNHQKKAAELAAEPGRKKRGSAE